VQAHRVPDLIQDVVHRRLGAGSVPAGNCRCNILMGLQYVVIGPERHQPLLGPAGQNLGNHAFQRHEHLIAAASEQKTVELDVGGQEFFEFAGFAQAPQVGCHVLKEPYLAQQGTMTDFAPVTVPRGQYFMMGDNRAVSDDSRYWGTLPRANIIGEAFATYWPLDRLRTL